MLAKTVTHKSELQSAQYSYSYSFSYTYSYSYTCSYLPWILDRCIYDEAQDIRGEGPSKNSVDPDPLADRPRDPEHGPAR